MLWVFGFWATISKVSTVENKKCESYWVGGIGQYA